MNPVHFLPPVLALAICGIWIGDQRRSIAALENQSAHLRKEIAAKRHSDNDSAGSRSSASGKEVKDKEPIDWKKIAEQFDESRIGGGIGDMRTMMRLNQRLMAMDKDELTAALDEISSLDLPDQSRAILEQMLIGQLIEKEPEFALTKFIGRINDEQSGLRWRLSHAFGEWAKKDSAAATAWFDRHIAAGTFESKSLDGKSQQRMQFEGAIVGTLLASNPEAASLRLAALPENQRRDVMQYMTLDTSSNDANQLAYAKLVRQSLPEKDRTECLASYVSKMAYPEDNYSAVTERMERIEATPAERSACVEKTAEVRFQQLSYQREITRDDIEKLRTWSVSQSPEMADRVTGIALETTLRENGKTDFAKIAALATEYHNSSGSDEVLVPLLKSWQARKDENMEQARALAERISDESVRTKILQQLK